jgi:CheY-like chemotaxis protein
VKNYHRRSRVVWLDSPLTEDLLRPAGLEEPVAAELMRTRDPGTALEGLQSYQARMLVFGSDVEGLLPAELCRRVRDNRFTRRASVLLLCRSGDREVSEAALSYGCNEALFEPFDETAVIDAIRRLTEVPRRVLLRTLTRLEIVGRRPSLLGQSVDVSASGMLLQTRSWISPDEPLSIEFYLPEDAKNPVRARAEIVRVEDGSAERKYGLRFVEIGEWDRARIEAHVQRLRTGEAI